MAPSPVHRWLDSRLVAVMVPLATGLSPAASPAQQADQALGQHADQPFVFESLVVRARFENGGTSEISTHVRVRVQSEAGVRYFGQLAFPYSAATQDVVVEHVRVHKMDGSTVTAGAEAAQDVGSEVQLAAPVYTDQREKHVTVPALRPGDLLEYRVIYRTHTPFAPGHFWFEHEFSLGPVVLEERLELDLPADHSVTVKTRRGPQPGVSERNGRRTYVWQTANREPLADTALVRLVRQGPAVAVTTFRSWDDVARWYDGLQRDRVLPTDGIRKLADQLVVGAGSDRDTVEALYRYVATSVRYVSISLGLGRYQPHVASAILTNQYGDCKDKHTLLAALLAAVNRSAWPALASSWREIDPEVPSPAQFDHLVTAVPGVGPLTWLDATTEVAPFGLLTANLRGKDVLVIPSGTPGRLERIPTDPPFPTFTQLEFVGGISSLGSLSGSVAYTMRGDWELVLRTVFRAAPRNRWEEVAKGFAESAGFGNEVQGLQVGDPQETGAPFRLSFRVRQGDYANWDTKRVSVRVPLPAMDLRYEEPGAADSSVRLDQWDNIERRAVVIVPLGVRVTAPVPVQVRRAWAEYRSQYQAHGDTVIVVRTLTLKQRRVPRALAQEVAAFLRAIRADEQQTLTGNVTGELRPSVADEDVDDLHAAGVAAYDSKDYQRAIQLLTRVTEKDPRHRFAWNNLGRAYAGTGDLDRAMVAYQRQIEINPFDEYTYNNIGLIRRRQEKYDEAIASFRRQIDVSPLDRDAHANLGSLYLDLDRYGEAAATLETAARLDPDSKSIQLNLGKAYLKVGKPVEAGAAFDRFLTMETTPEAYLVTAQDALEHAALASSAQRWAEMAVRLMSEKLQNLDLSGHTEEVLREPLERTAELVQAWRVLGRAAWRAADLARAERFLDAAWTATLREDVGTELGRVYEALGRKTDAARVYASVVAETRGDLEDSAGTRLVALAGGRPQANAAIARARENAGQLKTVRIGGSAGGDLSLSLILVLGEGGRVLEVKPLQSTPRGSQLLAAVRAARLPIRVPADFPVRVLRRATLFCSKDSPGCDLVLTNAYGGPIPPPGAGVTGARLAAEPDRVCKVPSTYPELPPVDSVIDSTAAYSALAGLRRETPGRDPSSHVLLALRFEPDGSLGSARVIGGDSAEVGHRVQGEITSRVRPQRSVGDPPGLRLRVSFDRRVEFDVEPSVYCEPRFASPGTEAPRALSRVDFRKMEQAGPVTLRVYVNERGRVDKVEVVKSSGVPAFDELFASMAANDRFHPALLDGQPVPGTTEMTRQLSTRPARR